MTNLESEEEAISLNVTPVFRFKPGDQIKIFLKMGFVLLHELFSVLWLNVNYSHADQDVRSQTFFL